MEIFEKQFSLYQKNLLVPLIYLFIYAGINYPPPPCYKKAVNIQPVRRERSFDSVPVISCGEVVDISQHVMDQLVGWLVVFYVPSTAR